MRTFDLLNADLTGFNLIEASAGTGKTFAIAMLYLRLILEKGLMPGRILAVTFTEAATEELRGRVRGNIRALLDALREAPPRDPVIAALAERHHGGEAEALLGAALASFDEAAICTIHGFCARVLRENSFASGAAFDTELAADDGELLRGLVEDFWRHTFYGASVEVVEMAADFGLIPAALVRFAASVPKGDLQPVPETPAADPSPAVAACAAAYEDARQAWRHCRREVEEILCGNASLNRNSYRLSSIPRWLSDMDRYLEEGRALRMFDRFDRFCSATLGRSCKNGHSPPCHDFFDLCDSLHRTWLAAEEAYRLFVVSLRRSLLDFLRTEGRARRRRMNVRFFDDLLHDLRDALVGSGGGALAEALRERFPVALVDEFQDTDPVQYDIFRTVYTGSGSTLFLIGDPKQAIYSFRGADIFAYLRASREAERRHTLLTNRRSTPRLVAAVNALFSRSAVPFVFSDIAFHPAEAAVTPGSDPAPLRVWLLEGKRTNAEAAATVAAAVRAETVRLVEEEEVRPADIAVLVRTNDQAETVRRELEGALVPAVVYQGGNVFASVEAEDLHMVLAAVADPGNEPLLRRALATSLLGRTAAEINGLLQDDSLWGSRVEAFRDYHDLWRDKGFVVAARGIVDAEGVRTRLLRRPGGERSLTNLFHCIELLHRETHDSRLGMEALLKWFGDRRRENSGDEAYQMRLESDAEAVKIVTIHKSKGLQYRIVFVPFTWGGGGVGDIPVYHDRAGGSLVADFGFPPSAEARAWAEEEVLAENVRLLYVAVTRATERCYLALRPGASVLAAPDHLLGPEPEAALQEIASRCDGALAVLPLPAETRLCRSGGGYPAATALSCAAFPSAVPAGGDICSFTSLLHGHRGLPERDLGERLHEPAEGSSDCIASFPRGASAGSCLHEILEGFDFTASAAGAAAAVAASLRSWGYGPEHQPAVLALLERLRGLALPVAGGVARLCDLPPSDLVREMEFHFPLERLQGEGLRAVLERAGHADAAAMTAGIAGGGSMMKGFIDLVFAWEGRYYIVDWKSNDLGGGSDAYGAESLRRAMLRENYLLQYHLYAVALHRLLSLRLPGYDYDTHFGGVLYIFLRGIGAGSGVFADFPSRRVVEGLAAYLCEGAGA